MIGISLPPLWVITAVAGFTAGGYVSHLYYQSQRVDALEDAREVERAGVRVANQADAKYYDRLRSNQEDAYARAEKLQGALARSGDALRLCRLDNELVRLLNEPGDEPAAGAAPGAEPAAAAPQAGAGDTPGGATCQALVETWLWNVDHVIRPNQIQIEELQRFYNGVREEFKNRSR